MNIRGSSGHHLLHQMALLASFASIIYFWIACNLAAIRIDTVANTVWTAVTLMLALTAFPAIWTIKRAAFWFAGNGWRRLSHGNADPASSFLLTVGVIGGLSAAHVPIAIQFLFIWAVGFPVGIRFGARLLKEQGIKSSQPGLRHLDTVISADRQIESIQNSLLKAALSWLDWVGRKMPANAMPIIGLGGRSANFSARNWTGQSSLTPGQTKEPATSQLPAEPLSTWSHNGRPKSCAGAKPNSRIN